MKVRQKSYKLVEALLTVSSSVRADIPAVVYTVDNDTVARDG